MHCYSTSRPILNFHEVSFFHNSHFTCANYHRMLPSIFFCLCPHHVNPIRLKLAAGTRPSWAGRHLPHHPAPPHDPTTASTFSRGPTVNNIYTVMGREISHQEEASPIAFHLQTFRPPITRPLIPASPHVIFLVINAHAVLFFQPYFGKCQNRQNITAYRLH